MIDLIVAEVQRKQLVVREKQLGDHHGAVRLDLIQVQVQHLKVGAFFECFGQILRTLTLNIVALQV